MMIERSEPSIMISTAPANVHPGEDRVRVLIWTTAHNPNGCDMVYINRGVK